MIIAADNIDRLLAVEMRRQGIPRGFKWRIFEIARRWQGEPLCLAAARPLIGTPMRVALVTGAWVPEHMPVGRDDDGANSRIAEENDAFIAVERLGRNVNGILYSMNAFPLSEHQHAFDDCVDMMRAAGKPAISITDGGNEIGYGVIRDALIEALPDLNLADKTACGGGIVSATECDVLVVANSSNLGAYGVVAGLALLTGDATLCHEPAEELALHHVGVGLGLIDGGGGGAVAACDGIPAEASAAVVHLVQNIVERALEAPRERPF